MCMVLAKHSFPPGTLSAQLIVMSIDTLAHSPVLYPTAHGVTQQTIDNGDWRGSLGHIGPQNKEHKAIIVG